MSANSGSPPPKRKRLEKSDDSNNEDQDFCGETKKGREDRLNQEASSIDDGINLQRNLQRLYCHESAELLKVEQKYNKLRQPFFDERNGIIENISNFWVTALVNHPQISLLIDEDEKSCLHFLSKLEVEEFEDIKSGYRIKLYFDENPFFENDVLVKEFHLGTVGDPKSTSSEIKWKENMDLSKKQREVIAMRRKRGLEPKTFFSWLHDHGDPSSDDIAEVIKDDLWPNPFQYFLVTDIEGENGADEDRREEGEGEDESAIVIEEEEEEDQDEDDEEKNAEAGEEGDEDGETEAAEPEAEEEEEGDF